MLCQIHVPSSVTGGAISWPCVYISHVLAALVDDPPRPQRPEVFESRSGRRSASSTMTFWYEDPRSPSEPVCKLAKRVREADVSGPTSADSYSPAANPGEPGGGGCDLHNRPAWRAPLAHGVIPA